MTFSLEHRAQSFATWAHGRIDQRRKYTNAEYITHPAAVVEIVCSVPHTEEMLAAAWLHDTVEDCGLAPTRARSLSMLRHRFGDQVTEFVDWLTDVTTLADGNRKARKEIERQRLAKAPAEAQTIKLADLIDNTGSIVAFDPEFAVVYLAEKRALLEVMRAGDRTLWDRAWGIVERGGVQ